MVNKRIRIREKMAYLEHFPNLCWDEIIVSPIAYQVRKKQAYTKWPLTQVTLEYSGERVIFSINGAALTGYPYGKNVSNTIYTENDSRWTVNLNVKDKIIKHQRKKCEHLSDFVAVKIIKAGIKNPNMEENSIQESIIQIRTIYSKT